VRHIEQASGSAGVVVRCHRKRPVNPY
jgi:hypothetical protein